MEKEFDFFKYEEGDVWNHDIFDVETKEKLFQAYDLYEYPEDCTLERDLCGASDWIKWVNFGIELAKQGYDKAVLIEHNNPPY